LIELSKSPRPPPSAGLNIPPWEGAAGAAGAELDAVIGGGGGTAALDAIGGAGGADADVIGGAGGADADVIGGAGGADDVIDGAGGAASDVFGFGVTGRGGGVGGVGDAARFSSTGGAGGGGASLCADGFAMDERHYCFYFLRVKRHALHRNSFWYQDVVHQYGE
jgi:hypothetical protein